MNQLYRNRNKAGLIIAVISIVFNMNTLPMALYFSNSVYAMVTLVLYTVFLLFGLFTGRTRYLDKKIGKFLVAIFVLICFTMMVNQDFSILYGVLLLELFKAVVVCSFVDFSTFMNIYVKTISFLAAISLVLHFSILIVPGILGFAKIAYNANNIPFYSFGVYYKSLNEGFRNYGFLTEPGDYQHYLNCALLLYLFNQDKLKMKDTIKKWVPIVLTIACISTFSPAGIVFMACVWAAYFCSSHSDNRMLLWLVAALPIVLYVILSVPSIRTGLDYAIAKLDGSSTYSRNIRLVGITVGLKYFIKSPILGNGCTNAIYLMSKDLSSQFGITDQTSTISGFLAMFGVFTAMLFILPYLSIFISKNSAKVSAISKVLIFAGIMMSLNNERLIWELTYYIFVIYGVKLFGGSKQMRIENLSQ